MASVISKNHVNDDSMHPSTVRRLIGHSTEFATLNRLLQNHSHHAIILQGPKGIGKATIIYHALHTILKAIDSNISDSRDSVSMLQNKAHPDVFILEPDISSVKGQITMDQIRQMLEFVSLKPSYLPSKYVIIDSIDCLNTNAANALLKTLEEPFGRTHFLLVYSGTGTAISTLLSRCIRIHCHSCTSLECLEILDLIGIKTQDAKALSLTSDHNPGRALAMHNSNSLAFYKSFLQDMYTEHNNCIEYIKGIANVTDYAELLRHLFARINIGISHLVSEHVSIGRWDDFEMQEFKNYIDKYHPTPFDMFNRITRAGQMFNKCSSLNLDVTHLTSCILHMMRVPV